MVRRHVTGVLSIVLALFAATGCARYVTPGAGVALPALADTDIKELLDRKPTASFPARLATARVQAPGYRSLTNQGYGSGRYTVVTTRDVERDGDFERLGRLPMVAGVGPLNRLLLPPTLDSFKELRLAAASLRADMLLIYTFDTSFHVGGSAVPPLSVMSLGVLPLHEAVVTTTASAVVYDVRTAFVYGLADATARESQMTSLWTSRSAVDDARLRTEAQAFERLMAELEKTWIGIVAEHAPKSAGGPGPTR
jgi:hypothetical protein